MCQDLRRRLAGAIGLVAGGDPCSREAACLRPAPAFAQDTSPAATAERQIVDLNAELEGVTGALRLPEQTAQTLAEQRSVSEQIRARARQAAASLGLPSRTSTRGSISSDRRLPPVRPRPRRLPVNARRWIALARVQRRGKTIDAHRRRSRATLGPNIRNAARPLRAADIRIEPVDTQSGPVVGGGSFAGPSGRPADDIAYRLVRRCHDANVARAARSGSCRNRRPAAADSRRLPAACPSL